MSFIVTTKLKYEQGVIIRTPIAFPYTNGNVEIFNNWCDWTKWTTDNYNEILNDETLIVNYFNSCPNCYEGKIYTENINGMNLTLIEKI